MFLSNYADSDPPLQGVWSAVETALDVALLVMENGGSTFRADKTFHAILSGLHQSGVTALWQLNMVTVFIEEDGQTATLLRLIGPSGANLSRASAAWVLSQQVAQGAIAPADIPAEIQRIKALASPYSPWMIVTIAALTTASFSQMVGGDWGSFVLAGAAGAVGQFVRLKLQSRRFFPALVTLLCAILSGVIASLGLRLGLSQVVPATLIGSIGYMIPGLPLVNGFVDMMSQRNLLVGVERILNAAFLFLALIIGIVVADALVL